MLHSTHYNLNLAEGTDLVNPLTVDVPNYQSIDNTMFANEQAGVGTATELKSGTIHAITRANTNRNVFRFKSTSVFLTGDTFTVDGSTVTALYSDGSSLKNRCFIVGSDVLCLLDGTQLTVLTTYYPEANNVSFDDTNVSFTASNVQAAIEDVSTASGTEYSSGVSVKDMLDNILKCDTLLTQLNIAETATSYNCNWSLYYYISIEAIFYGNVCSQILVPTSYVNGTSAGERILLRNAVSPEYQYNIYKNGNNALYIETTDSNAAFGVRVYGIMKK